MGARLFDWLAKARGVRPTGATAHSTATSVREGEHLLFHGTASDFEQFRPGSYFTRDAGQAATYAKNQHEAAGGTPRVIAAVVQLRNPALRDGDCIEWAGLEATERDRLEAAGHDGMANPSMTEVVIFRPEQVRVLFVAEHGGDNDATPSPKP